MKDLIVLFYLMCHRPHSSRQNHKDTYMTLFHSSFLFLLAKSPPPLITPLASSFPQEHGQRAVCDRVGRPLLLGLGAQEEKLVILL